MKLLHRSVALPSTRSLLLLVSLPALVVPVLLMAPVPVPAAGAGIPVPDGWYSGDVHVHWHNDCYGVAPAESIYAHMPPDLNLASVLIWNGGGDRFEPDAEQYFRGRENAPVSTPNRLVRYDLEVSGFAIADRLGHIGGYDLADIYFPRATYQAPIQDWIHDQGAIVGSLHSQAWTTNYNAFPPLAWCCTPYELPVAAVFDRVDFMDYQGPHRANWRFLWYALLDCGFRIPIVASSDAWCMYEIGQYRTYARVEGGGDLTYRGFLDAVAAGRSVAVEESDNFVHFTVDGAEVGDEITAVRGQLLALQARMTLPAGEVRTGVLEIIRNHEVIGQQYYNQTGGEVLLEVTDAVLKSSWYAARTYRSHTAPVYVIVNGLPVRPSLAAPDYFIRYMDYFTDAIDSGYFDQLQPEDRDSLLARIAGARSAYEQILAEARGMLVATPDPGAGGTAPAGVTPQVWPNPFTGGLRFTLPAAAAGGRAVVRIYDADGRFIRRLEGGAGGRHLGWDGRDVGGREVPSGVYYYRVEAGGGRRLATGKLVRTR